MFDNAFGGKLTFGFIYVINPGKEDPEVDKDMDTDAPATPAHAPGGDPQIRKQMHDFRITNQMMYLHPSIEDARYDR